MSDRSGDNSVVHTAKSPTGGSSTADARGRRESARADPDDRGGRHQFGNRLARQLAVLAEGGQDPRHTGHVVGAGVELDDLGREVRAALLGRARAGGPLLGPVVIARLRHLERPSHPRDAEGGPLRSLSTLRSRPPSSSRFRGSSEDERPCSATVCVSTAMGSLINAITTAQQHLVETQRVAVAPRAHPARPEHVPLRP